VWVGGWVGGWAVIMSMTVNMPVHYCCCALDQDLPVLQILPLGPAVWLTCLSAGSS
jgi:hypothetical protein